MKNFYFFLLSFMLFSTTQAQIVNIPDANFKAKLLLADVTNTIAKNLAGNYFKIDANNDAEIQVSEALQVKELNVSFSNISNLTGIAYFTAINRLSCAVNQLNSLTLTNNTSLTYLACSNNLLTNLNVSNNIQLVQLICHSNSLINLNLSSNNSLTELTCWNNQLTNLDLSTNPVLNYLDCSSNFLTSLNLISNSSLANLYCDHNQLTSLYIKNGKNESTLDFSNNPNLQYICADDSQIASVQTQITTYGYNNCQVNSYCSFTPGGIFYTINGTNKFDSSVNGCDVLDNPFPNLKLNLSDGTNTGSVISNTTGNYSIPVQAGTYTITPILQNLSYFTVSPTTATVTFPTTTSPFTQNFCVTANGTHPDLEVSILPINAARPGFDATYKIVYKNNGTTTQSGSVNLQFDDAVLDFVSAMPTVGTQTVNNLNWVFNNLLPFESESILVTLNLNSTMETPALNSGSILVYNASITSPVTDETPLDNAFAFNQTVVNAFDPNDKTCLEGNTIAPAKVGDFVHYMIRFQNDGTAHAQNIVVKDMIDTTKFDMASLVPIDGSHSFSTKISNNNRVEFIFQNINLPFTTGSNQGYVSFKIKTKSSLVLGNTFSNTVNIYFDYNFPIVTNTATTTIAVLATQDFEYGKYFTIYPNPAKDLLNIEAKNDIEISSISIYNMLGQLVLVQTTNLKTIDISNLKTGNYFAKITTAKGSANEKFTKL